MTEVARRHRRANACVIQSCPDACPTWMGGCMRSVERWAASTGRRYVRIPDADFLGLVPDWFRRKSAGVIQPVTDLARVEAVLRHLDAGATEVIWVDADVVVVDEDAFLLPDGRGRGATDHGIAFTREVWLDVTWPGRTPYCVERVNNCVLVATDGAYLEGYRQTCLRIARECDPPFSKSIVSTSYFSELGDDRPFALVRHVANFSPHVLRAIVQADRTVLEPYGAAMGEPVHAANLCASYEGKDYFGTLNSAADYLQAVAVLLVDGLPRPRPGGSAEGMSRPARSAGPSPDGVRTSGGGCRPRGGGRPSG